MPNARGRTVKRRIWWRGSMAVAAVSYTHLHGLQVTGRGLLGKMDTEEFQVLDDVRVDVVPAS